MNDKELRQKVNDAMYKLMKEKGVCAPVEVLIAVGVLSQADYERWRRGQIPYLEKVCKINLSKLSTINNEIRVFARKNDLKPSWTFYGKWKSEKSFGKKKQQVKSIQLRFSKNGNESIEKLYATHYISSLKSEEAKKIREANKTTNENPNADSKIL